MLQHLLALGKPMETNMPSTSTYKHKHHIIPRHAGGTDDPSNLVELTIPEHAEAHRKLYEEYGRWQDRVAWQCLSGQITNYEAQQQARRLANLGNKHFEGKTHSDEYKKQLSEMMKERRAKNPQMGHHQPHSDETKKKLAEASMGNTARLGRGGQKLSDEFKEKCRQKMLKDNPAKRPEVREKLRQAALKREQKKRELKSSL